jgi:hypothetical protein
MRRGGCSRTSKADPRCARCNNRRVAAPRPDYPHRLLASVSRTPTPCCKQVVQRVRNYDNVFAPGCIALQHPPAVPRCTPIASSASPSASAIAALAGRLLRSSSHLVQRTSLVRRTGDPHKRPSVPAGIQRKDVDADSHAPGSRDTPGYPGPAEPASRSADSRCMQRAPPSR